MNNKTCVEMDCRDELDKLTLITSPVLGVVEK